MVTLNTRRSYAGAAKPTSLAEQVSSTATSFAIDAVNGLPDGSTGSFAICINRGKPNEEKVYVTTRTGETLIDCERGADGSQAFLHDVGETVEHIYTAFDADEANAAAADYTAFKPSVQTLLTSTGAWTGYVPTLGTVTSGTLVPTAGTLARARYQVVGKTCHVSVVQGVSFDSGTGYEYAISLPIPAKYDQVTGTATVQNQNGSCLTMVNSSISGGSGSTVGYVSMRKYNVPTNLTQPSGATNERFDITYEYQLVATLDKVDPELRLRVEIMLAKAKDRGVALRIASGYRSHEEQVRLYQLYLQGLGNTAAFPGSSKHEFGFAVDVECDWNDKQTRQELAKECGLHTPVPGEPWHMELAPGRKPLPTEPEPPKKTTTSTKEDESMCVRTITWPDGTKTFLETDGAIKGFGPDTFQGSKYDFKPELTKAFESNNCYALTPHDITDKTKGYTIWNDKGQPLDCPARPNERK